MKITFAVLVYNHSEFVIEHLNSLKFIVDKYNYNNITLIVNDDFSSDDSLVKIDDWLDKNSKYFSKIIKIYNQRNIGTVQSCRNIILNTNTDFIKITAADDIYLDVDILEYCKQYSSATIISGLPIYLQNHNIIQSYISNFVHIASSVIYKPKLRFFGLNAANAPNIIYKTSSLKGILYSEHFNNVLYVEDSLFYSLLITQPDFNFIQLDIPIVLYRRTPNSAYLIRSDNVSDDHKYIYSIFYSNANLFYKVIMKSNLISQKFSSKFFKYATNLAFYFFVFLSIINSPKIIRRIIRSKIEVVTIKNHLDNIK